MSSAPTPSPVDRAAFLRGWWHGARAQPAIAELDLPHANRSVHGWRTYHLGYVAGLDWREFHGPDRKPNTTHALDAMHLHEEGR